MSNVFFVKRGWRSHPLFRGEPYTRACAWLWLIENACWKPTRFDIEGRTITLKRGQLCASIRTLADVWGWSRSSVERFLNRLKTETMIETASGTGRLVITIWNYEKYQDLTKRSGTASGTATETEAGQKRDIKETVETGETDIPLANANGPSAFFDARKIMFDVGIQLLKSTGLGEQTARRIIGRWEKEHNAAAVVAAISSAVTANATHPQSFIASCLNARRLDHANPTDRQREIEAERRRIRDPIIRAAFDQLAAQMVAAG